MFGPPSPERKLRRRRKPLSTQLPGDGTNATASAPSAASDCSEPPAKRSRSGRHPSNKHSHAKEFVARFRPSSTTAVAAPQSRASNAPPAEQSRRPRLRLYDRCRTDDERQQRQLILNAHPHVAQAFFGANDCPQASFPFTRTIDDDYPCLPYRERRFELKSVVPWGQRRLLLAELEFLTVHAPLVMFGSPAPTVVYAGAAPGAHLSYLASLFPSLAFHLIDPSPFKLPHLAPNLAILPQLFDDSLALDYCGQDVLFISDVRSADLFHSTVRAVDAAIQTDLSDQMRWHELMAPLASMLKWRLPWTEGETDYLDGEVRLPVWGSQSTTEGRLWVKGGAGYRRWKHRRFEQQMYHFNTRQRVQLHTRPAGETEREESKEGNDGMDEQKQSIGQHRDKALSGLDGCYDCTVELLILKEYLLACPQQQERLRQRIRKQAREQRNDEAEDETEESKNPNAQAATTTSAASAASSLHSSAASSHVASATSSAVVAESPSGALQRAVVAHASMLDSLIPNAIRRLHLQQPHVYHREGEEADADGDEEEEADGGPQAVDSRMDMDETATAEETKEQAAVVEDGLVSESVETGDEAKLRAVSKAVQASVGLEEGCLCIDCLCVVMSDEISAELCEGRTLLTAPLLPAAIGTADFSARKMEKKQNKRQRQRIKRQTAAVKVNR